MKIAGELEGRSPGNWELYRKRSESRETFASSAGRRDAVRSEEGWSARWWEKGGARFAAASSEESLTAALAQSDRVSVAAGAPPRWPVSK